MAWWRFLGRWSDPELAAALALADELSPNFDPGEDRSPQLGWNQVVSHARIAVETAGTATPGGTFERLWAAIEGFEHSDPRIVVAHFRPKEPLDGRVQLLELRALGLGFLCPSRIAGSGAEKGPLSSRRWLVLDTLEGHIERGREYFFLEKDHGSGEIRFRIEASWQYGDFPNRWSRFGFLCVGRRYQRAWHRLAHLRLRRIAADHQQPWQAGAGGIVHRGVFLPAEPVQLYAQRGLGRRFIDVEQEGEDVRSDELWTAVGLGALSGVRSLTGPSTVLRSFEERGVAPKTLAAIVSALALGELAADKLPFVPARTRLLPLIGRMASGAYVGAASRLHAGGRFPLAVLGAVSALLATYASHGLRRSALRRSARLGWLVAATEDAVALGASRWLVRNHLPPVVS